MIKKDEFELNKPTLLKLHEKVAFKEALSWGEFRSSNVRIGGAEYLSPKSSELDKIFYDGLKELNKISHPIIKEKEFRVRIAVSLLSIVLNL